MVVCKDWQGSLHLALISDSLLSAVNNSLIFSLLDFFVFVLASLLDHVSRSLPRVFQVVQIKYELISKRVRYSLVSIEL